MSPPVVQSAAVTFEYFGPGGVSKFVGRLKLKENWSRASYRWGTPGETYVTPGEWSVAVSNSEGAVLGRADFTVSDAAPPCRNGSS